MASGTVIGGATPRQPGLGRMIVAAMIGNVLEWFDFVVYGFFAVTIAEVFFPAHDPTVSMLITFGAFGLAYFVRAKGDRSEEHTSELQSQFHLVCRLLLEKKNTTHRTLFHFLVGDCLMMHNVNLLKIPDI